MVLQKLFVVAFVLASLILPFAVGEIFPVTTAPMFRDQPGKYCDFAVFAPDGTALPLETLGLQRYYDGNPVGYGSGRLPAETLDRFGDDGQVASVVPTRAELREWVSGRMTSLEYPYLRVQVRVWGPVGSAIGLLDESFEVIVAQPPTPAEDRGSPLAGEKAGDAVDGAAVESKDGSEPRAEN